jgi:hypothetical protein
VKVQGILKNDQPLSVRHIQIILTLPSHTYVAAENRTHVDTTFFTQNDFRNNLLKL